MQTIIRILIPYCNQEQVVYLAAAVLLVWAAIRVYQYFRGESIRAKQHRKMLLILEKMCSPGQVSWLRDDSRNGEPPG